MSTEISITGFPLIFWVVIVKKIPSCKYCVLGGSNRNVILKRITAHDVLLYMRPFSDMHAAIGHKLFLEYLSPEAMEHIIRNDDFPVTLSDYNCINIKE